MGTAEANALEDCPTCGNGQIAGHLTTPVLALAPILVFCVLPHKAVEQLLFKRAYAKVTKLSPHWKLEEFLEKNMPSDSINL